MKNKLSKEQNIRIDSLINKCKKIDANTLDIYEIMDTYKCYQNTDSEIRDYIYDLVKDYLDMNNIYRKPTIFGYIRVSTKGQAKDGNSLEVQEKLLKENGCEIIYSDTYTGVKTDRPEFNKLIKYLRKGDTLVVTKLDRFARSIIQGSQIVNDLIEKGVRVNILNIGILDNTPSSKLIRNIFFSFAEFERDMIIERTREGKEIARQKSDFREGRPKKYTKKQIDLALNLLKSNSYKEVEQMTGISKSTLIRAKKKEVKL